MIQPPRIAPGGGHPVRVVVVGGGVTGLAAAYRLVELGARRVIPVEVTVCEAGPRPGGTIDTEQREGYLIEAGPDAFLTEKPWALDLCRRIGLDAHLVGTRPIHRRTFVVRAGRLHPLPDGFALLAPTRLGPLLRSRLFSWRGKARMALDLVLPARPADGDESLGRFVTRRLGREALERAAQPMVAGIYTADPDALSLAATMPRFLAMERRHGSVIRGLRRARDGHGAGGPRWSLFVAPADGMAALVAALASRLPPGALRLRRRVVSLERSPERAGDGAPAYRVALDDGSTLRAGGVVLACGSHEAARLVGNLDPDLAGLLRGIPYASSAVVTLAYRREEIAHPLDGFGFVVPKVEGRPIIACTFSSVKFLGRAPEGRVLLRVFLGGALDPGVLERDDAHLARTAADELRMLLGATAPPHLVRVHRHTAAMPQYLVGHLDRVSAIEQRAARLPGLALAGAAYRGVGIPDCIRSGEEAAERVLAACLGDRPAGEGAPAAAHAPPGRPHR